MSWRPMVLPGLYGHPIEPPRVHKAQRQTAREVFRRQRDIDRRKAFEGKGETREAQILRLLEEHWNATQQSPTALELLAWARAQGERLFDVNSVRPRLRALVEKGLVEPRAKRPCRESGETVTTWAVREAGSVEPR